MAIHYQITINQQEIVSKGWAEPFEYEGKKFQADFNTFALYDFLQFFSNLANKENSKVAKNENDFVWVNYDFIRKNNPLCNFSNNAYIKKHLFILGHFGLILIEKDKFGNVYFKLGENFGNDEQSFLDDLPQKPTQTQDKAESEQAEPISKPTQAQETPQKPTQTPKRKKANNSEQNITNAFNAHKDKIHHFTLDDVLEFAKHRDEMQKPITETGAVKIICKLIKLGIGAYDSIENSITNGWQGLFEPKTINFENSAYARERNKARGDLAKKYVTVDLDDQYYNDEDLKALNFQKSNTEDFNGNN